MFRKSIYRLFHFLPLPFSFIEILFPSVCLVFLLPNGCHNLFSHSHWNLSEIPVVEHSQAYLANCRIELNTVILRLALALSTGIHFNDFFSTPLNLKCKRAFAIFDFFFFLSLSLADGSNEIGLKCLWDKRHFTLEKLSLSGYAFSQASPGQSSLLLLPSLSSPKLYTRWHQNS